MNKKLVEPKPKWRRRSTARPDEILDAALDLFIAQGYAATRVEDIARAAGLSKGAVYLYFNSKSAIFEGLVQRAIVPVIVNAEKMAKQNSRDPQVALKAMITNIATRMSDPRMAAIPRLVIAEAGQFPELAEMYHAEVIKRGLSVIERLLKRGTEAGTFRSIDPKSGLCNVVGPIITNMLLVNIFGEFDSSERDPRVFIESHLDILFNGLLSKMEV